MPHSNHQLQALNALQQKLQTSTSWESVLSVIQPFIAENLAVESALVVPQAVAQEGSWPIGQTGFALQLLPQPENEDMAALTAVLIATAPFVQQQHVLSPVQQALLGQLSQAIMDQQQFDVITGRLDAAFAQAFPGCRARLVLISDAGYKKLALHSHFGPREGWLPVATDSQLQAIAEPVLAADKLQLALPVRASGGRVEAVFQVVGVSDAL
ncbi:MAG: hypothetical protein R3D55_22885, partial [Chloroflexota bacterium]